MRSAACDDEVVIAVVMVMVMKGMVVVVVVMVIMSVRPFRERANSRETEAGASGLDAPPECDTCEDGATEGW